MLNKFSYLKDKCELCKGKGFRFDEKREFRDGTEDNYAEQCQCVKKMAKYFLYDSANIPREYFDLSLEAFKEISPEKIAVKKKVGDIMKNIDSYLHEGRGLLLYGKRGTGKTMLALEILKAALEKGYSGYYEFYPVIFNEFMKKGYKSDEVKAHYDDVFAKKDFLILDELLKEKDYFNASSGQSDIVSSRFLEMNILKRRASKPTIIISNIQNGLEDISKHYGQYVASVMAHNYDLISFQDDDFREIGK